MARARKIRLRSAFRAFVVIALTALMGMTLLVLAGSAYLDLTQRADRLRTDFVEQQKQIIRREVDRIVERVEYRKSVLEDDARALAASRLRQAVAAAENIYRRNAGSRPDAHVREQILEALRAIRFDGDLGYFFVVDDRDRVIMHPHRPDLEGRAAETIEDARGREFFRTMLAAARTQGEASTTYRFAKPGDAVGDYAKVSVALLFEPYGWVIATGVYLDEIEAVEKERLLAEINQLRYGKNGYLFVDDWDGLVLAHGAQPALVGTNIRDFRDSKGVKVVQDLIAAAKTPHGDYVYYSWRKPDSQRERPKVSFARGVPDWQWMIGSGLYTDDIETDIALLEQDLRRRLLDGVLRILIGAVLIGVLLTWIANRFYKQLMGDFGRFGEFFRDAEASEREIDVSALRFAELQEHAELANRMLRAKVAARRRLEEHQARLEEEVAERTRWLEDKTRQLELARDQADAANSAKSRFLANMSHELRTPLNAVLGFTRLMQSDPDVPEPHRGNLAVVDRSGEHLLALINSILDISKLEAGTEDSVRLQVCQPRQLLRDLIAMIRPDADAKGLSLELDVVPSLPRSVRTDPSKLRQILVNLLGNAVKFTEAGGICMRAEQIRLGRMDYLEIVVEDSGRGIPRLQIESVFDPFFQVREDETGGGAGLGLAICKRLAALLGGELGVCSTPGLGSRFACLIPAPPSESVALPPTSAMDYLLAPEQPRPTQLIVEDNAANRRLLRMLLERFGLPVDEAVNGAQAVERFAELRPALVWMDLRMPVMNGETATRLIRELDGGSACRIVAVTASAYGDEEHRLLAAGFDGFLHKPFRECQVIEMLERLCGLCFERRPRRGSPVGRAQPQTLAALPEDWLVHFRDAVRIGSIQRMLALVAEIRPRHEALAAQLDALLEGFELDRLGALVEAALDRETA